MFIHFGINTFHNEEWTDGSKPAASYKPSRIDARQWVETAKKAGMKYIILVTKHHEGFLPVGTANIPNMMWLIPEIGPTL